jgi:hypothetical protein
LEFSKTKLLSGCDKTTYDFRLLKKIPDSHVLNSKANRGFQDMMVLF